MSIDDNKTLLTREINKRYNKFVISKKQEKIRLPVVSSIPRITASTEVDEEYIKKTYQLSEDKSKLIFVKKKFVKKGKSSDFNWQDRKAEPHGFYWQAKAEIIKEGVRWGIIKTESVTGKVIAALGQYRLITHERAAKGIISNTQHLKLNLVDFYQDRFEALQVIESLINRESSVDYQTTIELYIKNLQMIQLNLQDYFAATELKSFYKEDAIDHLKQQIDQDIARAEVFLKLSTPNKQARGHRSLLEFVKQQMIYNLYEMQAINQEITYSPNRPFALTRGKLNDYIEDARKEIDSHRTDLRNRVTKKHHGLFAKKNKVITYDFAAEEHSPEREKQILLAISFIEKKDKINYTKNEIYTQKDQKNKEKLTVIKATNWRTHRNASTWLKSSLYFMFNVIKSFFVETREWEEESWDNKNFHLYATELRAEVKARQPIWYALIHFCRIVFIAVKDVMHGIYDSGLNVVIKMPAQIINDYKASKKLPEFESIYKQAELDIAEIKKEENKTLDSIKTECGLSNDEPAVSNKTETAQEQSTEAAQEQPAETAQEQPIEAAQEHPIETAPDQSTETVQEQPAETTQEQPTEAAQEQPAESKQEEQNNIQAYEGKFAFIKKEEIEKILKENKELNKYKFAQVLYQLSPGEQNDILTAIVRGMNAVGSKFTHSIYAKDPIGGLLFTTTYIIGVATIYFPSSSASVFGSDYVEWMAKISYAMGKSTTAAAIAGASSLSQAVFLFLDAIEHGPSSITAEALSQAARDPLTVAAYFITAYAFGYFLCNGLGGYPIPWLSKTLKADLGNVPEVSYPFVGTKFGFLIYEIFDKIPKEIIEPLGFKLTGRELAIEIYKKLTLEEKYSIDRYLFVLWLSVNSSTFPKLESETLFEIERHIDDSFDVDEAASLKKILYPQSEPSIAFQIVYIPLSYIPALLRFGFAFLLSLAALINGNANPGQPILQAGKSLGDKIKYDLNRLIICAIDLIYFCSTLITCHIKALAVTINMLACRIASLFDYKIATACHKGLADAHILYRDIGEFFYPACITRSVVSAHPLHTIKEVKNSYKILVDAKKNTPAYFKPAPTENSSENSSPAVQLETTQQPSTQPARLLS